MTPREVVLAWVGAFNRRDADAAAALYHAYAVNHQVAAGDTMVGRETIREDFHDFFRAFPDSVTHVETLFTDGEWAILEWSGGATWLGDFAGRRPNRRAYTLRGCGFFHVVNGLIEFQRGYWDKATWFDQLGIGTEGA